MTVRPLSAVVVRWRGGDEVDRCLQSLSDHGTPDLERLILVDSGSGDGGAERLAEAFPSIRVVALDENRSFAWAVAQGAAVCPGDDLLILNPDTCLEPGTVSTLKGHLQARPEIAGVVPRMVSPDGASQHRWQLRRLPTSGRLARGLAGPPQFPVQPPEDPVAVEQPAAAAWLVRRSVWDALDGLDPTFAPAWWEDVDFCARLARRLEETSFPASAGFLVVSDARVIHVGGSSLAHLDRREFLTIYHRNLIRYAERHHPRTLGMIRTGLGMSLWIRGLLRPAHRRAYLEARRGLAQ